MLFCRRWTYWKFVGASGPKVAIERISPHTKTVRKKAKDVASSVLDVCGSAKKVEIAEFDR